MREFQEKFTDFWFSIAVQMEYDDAGYYLSHIYDVLTIVYIQSEVNKSKFATMNGSLAVQLKCASIFRLFGVWNERKSVVYAFRNNNLKYALVCACVNTKIQTAHCNFISRTFILNSFWKQRLANVCVQTLWSGSLIMNNFSWLFF